MAATGIEVEILIRLERRAHETCEDLDIYMITNGSLKSIN